MTNDTRTNDTRTPDDIERDIDDERAQMSDTIDDLQKKFSVDAIVTDVGNMLRDQGGNLGRSISQTVGRNPAAVILIGVGLAWLFLGQSRNESANATGRQSGQASGSSRDRTASDRQQSDARPGGRANEGNSRNDDTYWYGGSQAPSDRNHASNGTDAADSLGHAASDLTDRLSEGLEDFSEEAKSRVLAARRAAHEARSSAESTINKGSRVASNFFQDQPLVVGALAVALGAAIGGVLPHSKIEDNTMGDSSDQLFADAQAMYRDERDKLMAAAQTAATGVKDEVRDAASDLEDLLPEGKTAGEVIVDRVSDAATRIVERATGEGEQQGLGRRDS